MRAGCAMSGMSRPAARGREEHLLLAYPGRDIAVTAVTVALTAAVFAAVASQGVLAHIQRVDDAWLRLMVSSRSAPVTAFAKFLNLLGLVYVTLPVRIAITGYLALRRRWWHLAAFVAAIATSEILIGTLKGIYDRARPTGSLVATSGASFPSGHSDRRLGHRGRRGHRAGPAGAAARLVGRGRGGLLGPDGALACLPRRPLAVRRRSPGFCSGRRAPCWPRWWSACSSAAGATHHPVPAAHGPAPDITQPADQR